MADLIHQDTHSHDLGPRWMVQQFAGTANPDLVRFTKRSKTGKLLDRTAEWNGEGWSPERWVPAYPQVPKTLLAIVEQHMRGAA